jgi:hypothetical protein
VDIGERRSGDLNARSGRRTVNTHVHLPPNFSAFDSAEQAVSMAADEGLAALGTSNYHDFRVYRRFAEAAADAGVTALFGVEILALDTPLQTAGTLVNDPSNPGRVYLCGKALSRFDPPSDSAARLMAAMRAASDERMRQMTALVGARFAQAGLDGGWTDARVAASVAERCDVPVAWISLQERHVARAFQELLFREVPPENRVAVLSRLLGVPAGVRPTDATAIQEAIRSNLMKAGKPAFVSEAAVSLEDGYRLILELGGIPCYPILADGATPICPFEDPPEALVERLLARGIFFAELIPGRNQPRVVDRYVVALRRAGIPVVAGTEHNTQRMIPVAPTAIGGASLSDMASEAFWEGTCILAAHQELAASGRAGYVDREGRLSGGFTDGEARIKWFRDKGAELIAATSSARVQS